MIKINPVLQKELMVKMRGWKNIIIVSIYLLVLTLVAMLIMLQTFFDPYGAVLKYSTTIYSVVSVIQLLLILFLVPAFTASSVSQEREKQTLDLLLSTNLRPRSIILGKLVASISEILMLVFASLPIFSIVFMFGAISFKQVFSMVLYLMLVAITVGSFGIFFSTYFKRTLSATIVTYAVVLFLTLGTLLISLFYLTVTRQIQTTGPEHVFLMYINPFMAFINLLGDQLGGGGIGMISPAVGINYWQANLIFSLICIAVLFFLSSYRINPVRHLKFGDFPFRNKK